MRKFAWLLLIFCGIAQAADVEVFGVRLGEKPALPICAIAPGFAGGMAVPPDTSLGDYVKPIDADACMTDAVGGGKDVLFTIASCPKFTFACAFSIVVDENENAVGFRIPTGGEGAKQLAYAALVKKFGKPSRVFSAVTQNGFGARFSNRTYIWNERGFVVQYDELNGDLREGMIVVDTPESRQIKKARTKPASAL